MWRARAFLTESAPASPGLSKSTLSQKAKQFRDILKMSWVTTEYLRDTRVDDNPVVWRVEVNGLTCDTRRLPFELQVQAYAKGLIPLRP